MSVEGLASPVYFSVIAILCHGEEEEEEEWINKRKEAKKLIYIPDSLVNSLDVS